MKTGSKALLTGTGLIAAFAVFFAVNIIVNQGLRDTRIDLTEARLYTLSDGTRNVLKAIPSRSRCACSSPTSWPPMRPSSSSMAPACASCWNAT